MQGFAVALVLILLPLSGLVIATRRQPVAAGSGRTVRAKKRDSFIATFWRWVRLVKGRAMDDSAFITVGRASLDAVMRERDNAVTQLAALRTERAGAFARDAAEVRQAIKDRDVLIDKLRKDNAVLKADNERLVTMAAQWAGAKDPARMTVIDRDRLARLEALEQRARGIIGELVNAVDKPGYQEIDWGEVRY